MEAVNGVSDGGGPPPPSPLTGCYLLIVIGEPHSQEHKNIILQRIAKGLLSWDINDCLIDLEKELAIITEQAPEGEEARYGERLIQYASENLVTEVLIHPAVSTLAQCVRNLLSSFTRHRHIIHAGYTFAANGSWILQDGTFSYTDFAEAFHEIEVQRVIRAYENSISVDLHCSSEGDWAKLPKESFTKNCKVRVNPVDVLTSGSPPITNFLNYISPYLVSTDVETLLECSDVVGNIRFSHPTLYIFPGGQGDAALFGINGFNMLLDGGFSRKACFWDFVRHLDRLDAVLLTRLNNGNACGISAVLRRKMQNAIYPQIGHFFCNIQERKSLLSPDGDKDKDPLLINLFDEGQEIITNLKKLNLTPQMCYRDTEPINLYHKVGHGTLDMYVLSPTKDSKEVKDFLHRWNTNDQKLFANQKNNKDFQFPLQNMVSICALLIWQPANPNDNVTRILYPGSTPQQKIFEGLDRLKNLEYIKYPVCSESKLVTSSSIMALKSKQLKDASLDKLIQPEPKKTEKLKEKPPKSGEIKSRLENKLVDNLEKLEMTNGVSSENETDKTVKKSDSTDSDKSVKSTKPRRVEEKIEEKKYKLKESKTKPKAESKPEKKKSFPEKKASPTTPKKTVEPKVNGEIKEKEKPLTKPIKYSPSTTPAKSAKEATNRKVIESKNRMAAKKEPKVLSEKKDTKPERKPISRRSKGPSPTTKTVSSPIKKVNGVQKPDIIKKAKLDKEGTTDSSTVSTPSADQKDLTKLTPEEIEQLKAQELADLKEEQEVVKEIEAVFRKGEIRKDSDTELRKVKDISIEDKSEPEEYLIIEKEEVEHDSLDDKDIKEDETQKHARDSEESEKMRKLSDEIKISPREKQDLKKQESEEVTTDLKDKEDKEKPIETPKEISVTSPEDKIDMSIEKKIVDVDNQEQNIALESQPDERYSATAESGATTAPTLPEDERITLDEIKEDNGDQVIEEKHVKEDTKEKDVPVIQLPAKTFEPIPKLPPVVGIRLDKQSHIRDIVKTPDEVADLPVHEEADIEQYQMDVMKSGIKGEDVRLETKPQEKIEADMKEEKEKDTTMKESKLDIKEDETSMIQKTKASEIQAALVIKDEPKIDLKEHEVEQPILKQVVDKKVLEVNIESGKDKSQVIEESKDLKPEVKPEKLEESINLETKTKAEVLEEAKDLKTEIKPEVVEESKDLKINVKLEKTEEIVDLKAEIKPEDLSEKLETNLKTEQSKDMEMQAKSEKIKESIEVTKEDQTEIFREEDDLKTQDKTETSGEIKDMKSEVKLEEIEEQKDLKVKVELENPQESKDLEIDVKQETLKEAKDLKTEVKPDNIQELKDLQTEAKLKEIEKINDFKTDVKPEVSKEIKDLKTKVELEKLEEIKDVRTEATPEVLEKIKDSEMEVGLETTEESQNLKTEVKLEKVEGIKDLGTEAKSSELEKFKDSEREVELGIIEKSKDLKTEAKLEKLEEVKDLKTEAKPDVPEEIKDSEKEMKLEKVEETKDLKSEVKQEKVEENRGLETDIKPETAEKGKIEVKHEKLEKIVDLKSTIKSEALDEMDSEIAIEPKIQQEVNDLKEVVQAEELKEIPDLKAEVRSQKTEESADLKTDIEEVLKTEIKIAKLEKSKEVKPETFQEIRDVKAEESVDLKTEVKSEKLTSSIDLKTEAEAKELKESKEQKVEKSSEVKTDVKPEILKEIRYDQAEDKSEELEESVDFKTEVESEIQEESIDAKTKSETKRMEDMKDLKTEVKTRGMEDDDKDIISEVKQETLEDKKCTTSEQTDTKKVEEELEPAQIQETDNKEKLVVKIEKEEKAEGKEEKEKEEEKGARDQIIDKMELEKDVRIEKEELEPATDSEQQEAKVDMKLATDKTKEEEVKLDGASKDKNQLPFAESIDEIKKLDVEEKEEQIEADVILKPSKDQVGIESMKAERIETEAERGLIKAEEKSDAKQITDEMELEPGQQSDLVTTDEEKSQKDAKITLIGDDEEQDEKDDIKVQVKTEIVKQEKQDLKGVSDIEEKDVSKEKTAEVSEFTKQEIDTEDQTKEEKESGDASEDKKEPDIHAVVSVHKLEQKTRPEEDKQVEITLKQQKEEEKRADVDMKNAVEILDIKEKQTVVDVLSTQPTKQDTVSGIKPVAAPDLKKDVEEERKDILIAKKEELQLEHEKHEEPIPQADDSVTVTPDVLKEDKDIKEMQRDIKEGVLDNEAKLSTSELIESEEFAEVRDVTFYIGDEKLEKTKTEQKEEKPDSKEQEKSQLEEKDIDDEQIQTDEDLDQETNIPKENDRLGEKKADETFDSTSDGKTDDELETIQFSAKELPVSLEKVTRDSGITEKISKDQTEKSIMKPEDKDEKDAVATGSSYEAIYDSNKYANGIEKTEETHKSYVIEKGAAEDEKGSKEIAEQKMKKEIQEQAKHLLNEGVVDEEGGKKISAERLKGTSTISAMEEADEVNKEEITGEIEGKPKDLDKDDYDVKKTLKDTKEVESAIETDVKKDGFAKPTGKMDVDGEFIKETQLGNGKSESQTESPETSSEQALQTFKENEILDKIELGRKSPKEREQDVAKIVASVAEVLKSDAPLEEFEGKIPLTIAPFVPFTATYTTELRETHITTVDSPVSEICSTTAETKLETKILPLATSETKIEEIDKESKISNLLRDSKELMEATSKIISEIKSSKAEDVKTDADTGTVHRMLVTASSEDGGEETEICPNGTITFSKSSESSGRSSPDQSTQKLNLEDGKITSDTSAPDKVFSEQEKADLESTEKESADKEDLDKSTPKSEKRSQELIKESSTLDSGVTDVSKQDLPKSGKSTPDTKDISGKSTPEIKDTFTSIEADKKSSDSGRSTPESVLTKMETLIEPVTKIAFDSGRSSPGSKSIDDTKHDDEKEFKSIPAKAIPDKESETDKPSLESDGKIDKSTEKSTDSQIKHDAASEKTTNIVETSPTFTSVSAGKDVSVELLEEANDEIVSKDTDKGICNGEKNAPELEKSILSTTTDLSGKSTPDVTQPIISGKSSPDLKQDAGCMLSKVSTPGLKEDAKEVEAVLEKHTDLKTESTSPAAKSTIGELLKEQELEQLHDDKLHGEVLSESKTDDSLKIDEIPPSYEDLDQIKSKTYNGEPYAILKEESDSAIEIKEPKLPEIPHKEIYTLKDEEDNIVKKEIEIKPVSDIFQKIDQPTDHTKVEADIKDIIELEDSKVDMKKEVLDLKLQGTEPSDSMSKLIETVEEKVKIVSEKEHLSSDIKVEHVEDSVINLGDEITKIETQAEKSVDKLFDVKKDKDEIKLNGAKEVAKDLECDRVKQTKPDQVLGDKKDVDLGNKDQPIKEVQLSTEDKKVVDKIDMHEQTTLKREEKTDKIIDPQGLKIIDIDSQKTIQPVCGEIESYKDMGIKQAEEDDTADLKPPELTGQIQRVEEVDDTMVHITSDQKPELSSITQEKGDAKVESEKEPSSINELEQTHQCDEKIKSEDTKQDAKDKSKIELLTETGRDIEQSTVKQEAIGEIDEVSTKKDKTEILSDLIGTDKVDSMSDKILEHDAKVSGEAVIKVELGDVEITKLLADSSKRVIKEDYEESSKQKDSISKSTEKLSEDKPVLEDKIQPETQKPKIIEKTRETTTEVSQQSIDISTSTDSKEEQLKKDIPSTVTDTLPANIEISKEEPLIPADEKVEVLAVSTEAVKSVSETTTKDDDIDKKTDFLLGKQVVKESESVKREEAAKEIKIVDSEEHRETHLEHKITDNEISMKQLSKDKEEPKESMQASDELEGTKSIGTSEIKETDFGKETSADNICDEEELPVVTDSKRQEEVHSKGIEEVTQISKDEKQLATGKEGAEKIHSYQKSISIPCDYNEVPKDEKQTVETELEEPGDGDTKFKDIKRVDLTGASTYISETEKLEAAHEKLEDASATDELSKDEKHKETVLKLEKEEEKLLLETSKISLKQPKEEDKEQSDKKDIVLDKKSEAEDVLVEKSCKAKAMEDTKECKAEIPPQSTQQTVVTETGSQNLKTETKDITEKSISTKETPIIKESIDSTHKKEVDTDIKETVVSITKESVDVAISDISKQSVKLEDNVKISPDNKQIVTQTVDDSEKPFDTKEVSEAKQMKLEDDDNRLKLITTKEQADDIEPIIKDKIDGVLLENEFAKIEESKFVDSKIVDSSAKTSEDKLDSSKSSVIVDVTKTEDKHSAAEKPEIETDIKTETSVVEKTVKDIVTSKDLVIGTEIVDKGIKDAVRVFIESEKHVPIKESKSHISSIASSSKELSKTEESSLSGKSTPDIADVERDKQMQETLTYEKHIPGCSTPPTVPVSPIIKDIQSDIKSDISSEKKIETSIIATVREQDVRSYTPASDEYEHGVSSTHSDISLSQMSRAPTLLEGEEARESDEDDILGSPTSVTSQIGHSPSSQYDFDDDKRLSKTDQMSVSFYGTLPGDTDDSGFKSGRFLDDSDLDFEKAMQEHRQARGEDLTGEPSSYLYEITTAKYSGVVKEEEQQKTDIMTSSFIGTELPSRSTTDTSKQQDPIGSWGKPLGLPSPAPPDNKSTPKKEKKLPPNVTAKNKLNDDKKRSESPSKYDKKQRKANWSIYVDLTYVPHHGNSNYSYVDFFKRIRARHYVFSGIEPSKEVYNALLEAKQTWEDKELEVTIIPTYDTDVLGYWVAENEELLTKYKIDLSPSASRCTINLQDHETSCSAYRLEF